MENAEGILQILEEFTKCKPKDIPKELEEYLQHVAKTGDPVFQWSVVKYLFKEKLAKSITDFYESSPALDIQQCPNVEPFTYDTMRNNLLERVDTFSSAPFTVQRICELLINPKKEYSRVDKYMRAIEKNILVVSTKEPCFHKRLETNTQPELLMNGIIDGRIELGEAVETVSSEGINLMHVSESEINVTETVHLECSTEEIEIGEHSTNSVKVDVWEHSESVSNEEVKTSEADSCGVSDKDKSSEVTNESGDVNSAKSDDNFEGLSSSVAAESQEIENVSEQPLNEIIAANNSTENNEESKVSLVESKPDIVLVSSTEKDENINVEGSNEEVVENSVESEASINIQTNKEDLTIVESETQLAENETKISESIPESTDDDSCSAEPSTSDETDATVIVEQSSEASLSLDEVEADVTSSVTISEVDTSVDSTVGLEKECEPVVTTVDDKECDTAVIASPTHTNEPENIITVEKEETIQDNEPSAKVVSSEETSESQVVESSVEAPTLLAEDKIEDDALECTESSENPSQAMEQVSSSVSQDEAMEVDEGNNQPMEVESDEPMDQSEEVETSGES